MSNSEEKAKELSYERYDVKRRLKTYSKRLAEIKKDVETYTALLIHTNQLDLAREFVKAIQGLEIISDLLNKLSEEI